MEDEILRYCMIWQDVYVCGILGSIEEEKRRTSRPKGRLRWISFERPRLPLTPNCEKRRERKENER